MLDVLDKIFNKFKETPFDVTKPPDFKDAWKELQQVCALKYQSLGYIIDRVF